MLKRLIKIANELDRRGLVKEADYFDVLIRKASPEDGPASASDSLTEDELGNMTPEEYIEIVNSEREEANSARKSTFPSDEHPLQMLEYNKETAFIKYDTALDMVRNQAIGIISDVFKEINGFRPRYRYGEMSLKELNEEVDKLIEESEAAWLEERHGEDQEAWVDQWAAERYERPRAEEEWEEWHSKGEGEKQQEKSEDESAQWVEQTPLFEGTKRRPSTKHKERIF